MNWKKLVSFVLSISMIIGALPTMASATEPTTEIKVQESSSIPFTDVKSGDWFADAVNYVYSNGLMVGMSEGRFEPSSQVTRAMIVQILYANAAKPSTNGTSRFSDVDSDAWYADSVAWAVQQGVVSGYSNGTFQPNRNITREEMAVMLYGMQGKPDVSGFLNYSDSSSVSVWSKDAMLWATQNGLISGTTSPNGTILDPKGNATRAQAAVILRAYCELGQDSEDSVYSITDLTISGRTATIQVTAPRACTATIKFLNENTDAALNVQASAYVPAGTELGNVTASIAGNMLPTHYKAVVTLTNSSGKQLCNQFTCMKYTSAQEEFDAQTVDDFDEDRVINFDDDKQNNFGVLADTVEKPTIRRNVNVIAQNDDSTYTVTNIDSTVKSLASGDEALFYDADGEPVLVSIGKITISGTTAKITLNEDTTLSDYYDVLKIDTEAVGNRNDNSRSAEYNSDDIVVDILPNKNIKKELSGSIPIGPFTATASGEISFGIKAQYDVELWGPDYFYFEAKAAFSISLDLDCTKSFTSKDAAEQGYDLNIGLIPGHPDGIDIPTNIPGLTIRANVTLPVEFAIEGGLSAHMGYHFVSGFSYKTLDNGPQTISDRGFDDPSIETKASLSAAIGPKLEGGISILDGLVTAKLGLSAGIELSIDKANAGTTEESIHLCDSCFDGNVDIYLKADGTLSYKITKKLKGNLASITIFDSNWNVFTFYFSLLNPPEGVFKGQSHFGMGECPNKKYRITVYAVDANQKRLSGLPVTVMKQDTNEVIATGTTPYSDYFLQGTDLLIVVQRDNAYGSYEHTVDGQAKELTAYVGKNTGTLTGTVTDKSTGRPISGVLIEVFRTVNGNPEAVKQATTGSDGTYKIEELPVDGYTVYASADGYEQKAGLSLISAEQTDVVDFKLESLSSSNECITAYAKFLRNYPSSSLGSRFQLAYIDQDNIPELVIADSDSRGSHVKIYIWHNEQVIELGTFGNYGTIFYGERKNLFSSIVFIRKNHLSIVSEVLSYFSIINGKSQKLSQEFESYVNEDSSTSYFINGSQVSEYEFEKAKNDIQGGQELTELGWFTAYSINESNISKMLKDVSSAM